MQAGLARLAHAVRTGVPGNCSVEDGILRTDRIAAEPPADVDELILDLYRRLPEVRITDILLEVDRTTGFTNAFTHLRTACAWEKRFGSAGARGSRPTPSSWPTSHISDGPTSCSPANTDGRERRAGLWPRRRILLPYRTRSRVGRGGSPGEPGKGLGDAAQLVGHAPVVRIEVALAQQARTVDAEHMRPFLDELAPKRTSLPRQNPRVVACSPRTTPTGQSELTSGPQGCKPQPPRSGVSAWPTGVCWFQIPWHLRDS